MDVILGFIQEFGGDFFLVLVFSIVFIYSKTRYPQG
jgi:hypothetical protein